MEGWMKALSCASYDFMKLMVAELQKQLDDIDGIYFSGIEGFCFYCVATV
jgi:hypothetical protein